MNDTIESPATPITGAERIVSIDVLRGFALLGILVMNIPFFALSQYGWPDPFVSGGSEGADYWTWVVQELFFNMKMMGIFSMLFGAGIVVFTERAKAKGTNPTGLHYRRLAWLLVIGLIHAYLIWFGDILVPYVLASAIIFWMRGIPAKGLLIIAPLVMSVGVLLNIPFGIELSNSHAAYVEAQTALEAGATLTPEQHQAIDHFVTEEYGNFYPGEADLLEEIELRENGGHKLLLHHAEETFFWQTFVFVFWGFWRIGGLMLLGMGLYKLRVFDASRSLKVYGAMIVVGYALGLFLIAMGIRAMHAHDFDAGANFRSDGIWNYYGSILVSLGHIGLLMTICKLGALRWLTGALAAVGRMALTNYLMQSLICTFLFYWWGLGLWGTMSRSELMMVVAAIWVGQLVLSPIWLARFRFGPMEWLWRSLTYWKRQPMRRVGDSVG